MKLQQFCLFLGATAASQYPLLDDESNSAFNADFDSKVQDTLDHFHVPGIAIAILNGSRTHTKGYGLAELPDVPATPETLFYGASTSKAFTAAALSILIDDEEGYPGLTWSTPIADLIRDDFVLEDEYATTHLTLEDALSHRTGMPRHDFIFAHPEGDAYARDIVRKMRLVPMTAEPRTKFQYCNIMYTTVGYVVEQLSGLSLAEFWRKRIWKPLGMNNTYFGINEARASGQPMARGYFWHNDTQSYAPLPHDHVDAVGGAGAIISNVVDYAKWLHMMIDQSGPVSKKGHAALIHARSVMDEPVMSLPDDIIIGETTYGLGWFKTVYRGQLMIMHEGGLRAFGALVLYLPQHKWGFIAFGNTGGTSNQAALVLATHLIDEILSIPKVKRFDFVAAYVHPTPPCFAALERQGRQELADAKDKLFPHIPSPPVSPSLPGQAYAGTYSHPAYGNLTFSYSCETLHSSSSPMLQKLDFFSSPSSAKEKCIPHLVAKEDRSLLAVSFELEHVSGEYWLCSMRDLYTQQVDRKIRTQFRVGAEGQVLEMGIELDAGLAGIGGMIWFEKIEVKR